MATIIICDRCDAPDGVGQTIYGDLCGPCACLLLANLGIDAAVVGEFIESGWYELNSNRPRPAHNGLAQNGTAKLQPPTEPPSTPSPLATRLEELREQHGPVFVLDTTDEYAPDQVIAWGRDKKRQVQILEGTPETPRRWFGKLVDQ